MHCSLYILLINIKMQKILLFLIVSIVKIFSLVAEDDDGPLFLTPLIKNGEIKRAQSLASNSFGNVASYSGYLTVNKCCGNHLFIWFFPAVTNWTSAPVTLWLQGGPGASSLYGLFEEIGPYNHEPSGFKPRTYTWTNFTNLLFIDNPVGTGFSFSDKGCLADNLTIVCEELCKALTQFFKMFPQLQNNDFFLAGESFAGHYNPRLGVLIHNNCSKDIKINLKGIFIGNPEINILCHDYATFMYQLGLVDDAKRDQLYAIQNSIVQNVKIGNYTGASDDWVSIFYFVGNIITTQYNVVNENKTSPSDYDVLMNQSYVQRQLHVGYRPFLWENRSAFNKLKATISQSTASDVEYLLNTDKYYLTLYSGNLDFICLYTSTVCVIKGLMWPDRKDYYDATRIVWRLPNSDKPAGYAKQIGKLINIVIKDAGHSVPTYKPAEAFTMVKTIITAIANSYTDLLANFTRHTT